MEQTESLGREAPVIVRRSVNGIDEASCVDGDTSRLEHAIAFIDGLLRVSFDMFQYLVGNDKVVRCIREIQRQHIVVRVVCLDDFRRLQAQQASKIFRDADGKDAAGSMRQERTDRTEPVIHEIASDMRAACKTRH